MAEYGEPGARLYTIYPTLGINLQHHSLSLQEVLTHAGALQLLNIAKDRGIPD